MLFFLHTHSLTLPFTSSPLSLWFHSKGLQSNLQRRDRGTPEAISHVKATALLD